MTQTPPPEMIQKMRPGCKALIVHDGKILVVTEKVTRHGVTTIINDFPGGGMDFGEKFAATLEREVMEEVGLKIKVGEPVGNWDFVVDSLYFANTKVHVICLGYQCSVIGEAKIDLTNNPAQEDIFAFSWLTKEEILAKGEDFLINPEMLRAVERVKI